MSDQDVWDAVGKIERSNSRPKVVRSIAESHKMPSKIAEELDVPNSTITKHLNFLRDEGIIQVLTSEDQPSGKIYALTDLGEKAVEKLDSVN